MAKLIGIIGAGGWGTALASLLGQKGLAVTLWCHGAQTYRELRDTRENRSYLPGIIIPATVEVTSSLEKAVTDKEIVGCVVPSHAVRQVMSEAASYVDPRTVVVCGTKGLEEETFKTMGEVLAEILGPRADDRLAFISGPTFATEVAQGLPAALTVAAYSDNIAGEIQAVLSTRNLRAYTSKDVIGVQMGGVIKNVIAIAAGISDGLGLGHNARAALITRGLAEMTRLAISMGAEPLTLSGLPGVGDLILTCTGGLSRNRQVGLQIGAGKSIGEITHGSRMVAEGIRNARSVYFLAQKLDVEMPIVEQMYRIIHEGKKPSEGVRELMQRSLKAERS
jgi:glycerol-3-phosphate dehydrogenase (NAD(P)+)